MSDQKTNKCKPIFACSGNSCVYRKIQDGGCKFRHGIAGFNYCGSQVAQVQAMALELKKCGFEITRSS